MSLTKIKRGIARLFQHAAQPSRVEKQSLDIRSSLPTRSFNDNSIHLVTSFGGEQTFYNDIVWAEPYPHPEEYSRKRIGIAAEVDVLAKGTYNGGASTVSLDELIKKSGLVKLPNDELALNPKTKLYLDTFDPTKDAGYDKEKFSCFLVYDGLGLPRANYREVRKGVVTPPEVILTLFPNITKLDLTKRQLVNVQFEEWRVQYLHGNQTRRYEEKEAFSARHRQEAEYEKSELEKHYRLKQINEEMIKLREGVNSPTLWRRLTGKVSQDQCHLVVRERYCRDAQQRIAEKIDQVAFQQDRELFDLAECHIRETELERKYIARRRAEFSAVPRPRQPSEGRGSLVRERIRGDDDGGREREYYRHLPQPFPFV